MPITCLFCMIYCKTISGIFQAERNIAFLAECTLSFVCSKIRSVTYIIKSNIGDWFRFRRGVSLKIYILGDDQLDLQLFQLYLINKFKQAKLFVFRDFLLWTLSSIDQSCIHFIYINVMSHYFKIPRLCIKFCVI